MYIKSQTFLERVNKLSYLKPSLDIFQIKFLRKDHCGILKRRALQHLSKGRQKSFYSFQDFPSLITLKPLINKRGGNLGIKELQRNFACRQKDLGNVCTSKLFQAKLICSYKGSPDKGQLISKCSIGVIIWTKIPTNFFSGFLPQPLKRGQIRKVVQESQNKILKLVV